MSKVKVRLWFDVDIDGVSADDIDALKEDIRDLAGDAFLEFGGESEWAESVEHVGAGVEAALDGEGEPFIFEGALLIDGDWYDV